MAMARQGLSPTMVGRGELLARLQHMAAGVGDGQVALISGEAGVGKTRLVQELVERLPAGTAVLWGQAEQWGMGRPFQLLLDAVEQQVGRWQDLPVALEPRREALGLLLTPIAPQLRLGPERDYASEETLRAAVDLVRHLAGSRGLVVFEDLHWADAESLTLFARLAGAPDLPVALVGTYRPEDLDRRHLADLVASIERQHSVQHLVVPRLARPEVAQLLSEVYRRPVPYEAAVSLHGRTRGNPFFVEELLAAAGDAPPEALANLALPANLAEAVVHRLDGLDPEVRRAVDAAAVLGQRISFDLLGVVTGLGEDDLITVLRALVGEGLLVEEEPDLFSFRHALTREAVTDRLLGRERRRLHEKALVALEEMGSDDWAALAHHAGGAGRWEAMVEAARRGAARYLRTGSTWQALRLAELGLAEADEDLSLLELAARAAWSLGLRNSAIDRAEQWRRLARASGQEAAGASGQGPAGPGGHQQGPAGPGGHQQGPAGPIGHQQSHVQALRVLARLRWEGGDRQGQRQMAEEALAVASQLGPSEELAWAQTLMAEVTMLAECPEEAIDWADQALALADELGTAGVRAAALVNLGSALTDIPERAGQGQGVLAQAAEAAEVAGDHLSALRALYNLARSTLGVWPEDETIALVDRMDRIIERSGRRDWEWQVADLRGSVLSDVAGNLEGALAAREGQGQEVAPPSRERASATLALARLHLEAGRSHRAAELVAGEWHLGSQPGHQLDDESQPGHHLDDDEALVCLAGAEVAARQGDLAQARARLEAVVPQAGQSPRPGWLGQDWYRALHAAVGAGLGPAEARAMHARFGLAEPGQSPYCRAHVDPNWPAHLQGALLEAEGSPADAVEAYRTALAPTHRRRPPALVADVHLGLARSLLGLGRMEEAGEEAEEAARLLERWPGWRRDQAHALLRRLTGAGGGAPGGGAREGVGSLTAREREVAVLLAEGLSNAGVGRRLYISAKTASVHVSNILAKLGMSSRAEVAAWAVRTGLVPQGPGGLKG